MKFLFVSLLFLTSVFAGYEKVKIGEISRHYDDKITYAQLRDIIQEVETILESQLGFNVFDYSNDGKPINLVYLEPSRAEKRIDKRIKSFEKKAKKINDLKSKFPSMKNELKTTQKKYNIQSDLLNKKIEVFNDYVNEVNKKKQYPKKEYDEIKSYIKTKKADINSELKLKKSLERKLNRIVNKYNNKIHIYNNLISQSTMLAAEIESLQRSFKVVRGKTFGQKEIIQKTYVKDGQAIKEQTIKDSMNKIEIYSFENSNQLKAIIAHEIAHLVGIPHINTPNSLMNPVLQTNQETNLFLTSDDIRNFKENF